MAVCGQASSNLVETVDRLAENMEQSGKVNGRIIESAGQTLEDCAKSIDHIGSMRGFVADIKNVLEVLDGIKSANESNLRYVSEGIQQISAAKDEAVAIGEMQYHSKGKTEIIAVNSEQLKTRSHTIDEMSGQMDEMLKATKDRTDSIVVETDNQRNITNQTADTFQIVENTAKELFEISSNAPVD